MDNNLLKTLYRDSLSLLTDLYEITMAYAYWKQGLKEREAVFQLFFRKYPFQGGFAICAGAQIALEYIQNFKFSEGDLSYLEGLKLFEPAFLDYLRNLKISLDVDAMEEGTPVFPNEPLLRVKGPIIQAQIMESALLNIVNFQTLIATKSARVVHAAAGDHVVEFGLRRAQGIDGAISASRAAYIGGCHSTSNVMAGKLFGIPVLGTFAHSWVMAFEEEKEAFSTFAKTFPKSTVFLIDTYDTMKGVERAIEVVKELKIEMIGVRLDSGDLKVLSKAVRKKLDQAGLTQAKIMATNELNEERIADLKGHGAPIALWGVGTHLVTAKDQPALDGVYKLCAVQDEKKNWQIRFKISEEMIKTTNPGILQVRRYRDDHGYVADMIYDLEMGPGAAIVSFGEERAIKKGWQSIDLLVPMLRQGKNVYDQPSLAQMRQNTGEELAKFPSSLRKLVKPELFFSGIADNLERYKVDAIERIKRG
ncbi:MAG: nicotinate phosphoribosyltransferase [Verrucomicrobia bacterium]|nr:nicotinate phosphoribosyltransferase [Verrucomicrobiota bacterium]